MRISVLWCCLSWCLLAPPDLTAQERTSDHEALLGLHAELIRAHLDGDVDLWMSIEAERFTSVNGGQITFPSPEERREQRSPYLENTVFSRYMDLREPIVRVSGDGSLGWLMAEVEIEGEATGADGSSQSFRDVWAWVELYEKIDGRWRLVGNASNRRDG